MVKYGARIRHLLGNEDFFNIPDDFYLHSNHVSLIINFYWSLWFTRDFLKIHIKNIIQSKIISKYENWSFIFRNCLNTTQFKEVLSLIKPYELAVKNKEFALGIYLSRLWRGYTFDNSMEHW